MKLKNNLNTIKTAAVAAIITAAMPFAFAQTSTTQVSTTTSAGTISTFDPAASTLQITTETSTDPVAYSYTKETRFVDSTGAAVDPTVIKAGVPVSVYYTEEGDERTVSKVVVTKSSTTTGSGGVVEESERKTTTTTTEED